MFEDVTSKAGIKFVNQYCDNRIANILESNGAGGVWFDYDGDGFMDLYLVNSGPLEGVTHQAPGTAREPNRLYRNRGDGTFEDVTMKAGVAGAGYGTAAIAADYDNDGHTDLYVIGVGRCILYHNRGNGTFEDVTEKAGVANAGGTGIGGGFLDIDNDGYLDLFVANYLTFDPSYQLYFSADAYPGPLSYKPQFNRLYRNRGNGTFEDVSAAAGIQIPDIGRCPSRCWITTAMVRPTCMCPTTARQMSCSLTMAKANSKTWRRKPASPLTRWAKLPVQWPPLSVTAMETAMMTFL